MAATSASWGLGTHKMTADISSSTPVASPSTDSPIKAKSFNNAVDGTNKEQKTTLSPTASTLAENGNGATAAAVAAVAAASVAAKLSANSNGVGRVETPAEKPAEEGPVKAAGRAAMEDDGSDAAGTSSDSGDDDEEDERGGSSSAPGGAEGEAGGAEVAQTNGQQHGPVQLAQSAGVSAGNGHGSTSARQEADEHAARASDAATAALAAALASATREPPLQRSQAGTCASAYSSHSPTVAPQSLKAGVVGATSSSPSRHARFDPVVMVFPAKALPSGWDSAETITPHHVDRAMVAAGFVSKRCQSPPLAGTNAGTDGARSGAGGGDLEGMEVDEKMEAGSISMEPPLPLPLPTVPMPCMVGYFKIDEETGVHRCVGTWAMNKLDLEAATRVEARASPFEFKVVHPAGSGGDGGGKTLPFPHSGAYEGHFLVRQPPKPVTKVDERELNIAFVQNSTGGWNVEGQGRNIYGPFNITGRLGADRRLEVYRAYPSQKPRTPARGGHRRVCSGQGATAGAGAAKAPAAPSAARTPAGRGKHPRAAPPTAPIPSAFPQAAANGGLHVEDASVESPTPGRRVSRTPSYLIKDIGNEGTAHLQHGLRKCLTVLKGLMGVRGKSEWFLEPVDHVRLMLVDYPRIVKRPMDLGTVRKKLEGGTYQSSAEFAADVRLVFSNARLYNSDPMSLVHIAARELFEQFETKFASLGPNLDDAPLKRKKAVGTGSGGGGAGTGGANAPARASPAAPASAPSTPMPTNATAAHDRQREKGRPEVERDRKRKSGGAGGGGGGGAGGAAGGGSGSKKPRASSEDFGAEEDMPPTMLMMQRRITEMEATIQRMAAQQGQAAAGLESSPPAEPPHRHSSTKSKGGGSGRKSKGEKKSTSKKAKGEGKSSKATGKSKAGAKGGAGGKGAGGSKGGGQSRAAAKAAAKEEAAARARAAAEAEAQAAAAAAIPLTFDEKKALSVAINKLDQTNLTRVVEIIQARMPLGSSDEEIELDIDAMDNLTLRDLQKFIMDVSSKGRSRKNSGGHMMAQSDSDSDSETW